MPKTSPMNCVVVCSEHHTSSKSKHTDFQNSKMYVKTLIFKIVMFIQWDAAVLGGMSLPISLCVLAYLVRSVRMLVIPVATILVSGLSSVGLLYTIALYCDLIDFTPSLAMCLVLGLSVNYSLFLLIRFRDELLLTRMNMEAVETMLYHAGTTNTPFLIPISPP